MAYDPHLPEDCQGSNQNFPWNQTDEFADEPLLSKGSDCCGDTVEEKDGVLFCTCGHQCEEVFESLEEQHERLSDLKADMAEEAAISRWENRFEY